MITAVDTSVLLDILVGNPVEADKAKIALRRGLRDGSLVICETVAAELSPCLPSGKLGEFLDDCSIRFQPSSLKSAELAGETFRGYLKRGGKRGRVLADFLIGAHAQIHANRLLTRDRGYYRDYFGKLAVLEP